MNLPKIKFDLDLIFFLVFSIIYRKKEFKLYYLTYLFIFIHELSHILIASILKVKTNKITFSLCGCNIELENSIFKYNTLKDLLIKIAGPLFNLIMCLIFKDTITFFINLNLLLINLLPIIPLDGFYIFKDIIELITNNKKLSNKIIIILNNISIIIIFLIGIYFCIKYYNFSLLLFIVYVTIINMQTKNNYRLWNKIKELI